MEQTHAIQGVATPQAARRKRWRRHLLLAGPLVVALAVLVFWLRGGRYVTTDNAYLESDKVTVAANVAGTVSEVAVHDNQSVKAGDVLFRLDDEPYRLALQSAQAQLAQAEVDLTALQATYRQRTADIRQATTDVEFYQRQFARQEALAGRGVAAESALDAARRDLMGARSHVVSLNQEAQAILAQLGGDGGPVRNSRCCRRRTPRATGSRWCSGCRSAWMWRFPTVRRRSRRD